MSNHTAIDTPFVVEQVYDAPKQKVWEALTGKRKCGYGISRSYQRLNLSSVLNSYLSMMELLSKRMAGNQSHR